MSVFGRGVAQGVLGLGRHGTKAAVNSVSSRILSTSTKKCVAATDGDKAAQNPEMPAYYRTSEQSPLNHDQRHLGRLYTMDKETALTHGVEADRYPNWMVPKEFLRQQEVLNEHAFMIRKPMLEATSYLRQLKAKREAAAAADKQTVPNFKLILWGEDGTGKTSTLLYATDYCHKEGYIIINFYKMRNWYIQYKEMRESKWNPKRYDHVTRSQTLLKEFLIYNKDKIGHLTTHGEYTWSEREKTAAGEPLLNVVTQGIERPVFAADCVGVLFKELRQHCRDAVEVHGNPDHCKVATVVDGLGRLFTSRTLISRKLPEKQVKGPFRPDYVQDSIAPDELSIVRNVKKMLSADLPNSVVLGTVDITDETALRGHGHVQELKKRMIPETQPHYPFALLGQEGWEAMAPFLPVETGRYSASELDVMIDYYVDKRYIMPVSATDAGRAEIHFLSARHPKDFMTFSHEW